MLYRNRYGIGGPNRKVPAHMPHMLDKRILTELQAIFPKEYDQTSAHRFRTGTDMQLAFAYFHYIRQEKKAFHENERGFLLQEFDINGDKHLDISELRILSRALTFMDTYPSAPEYKFQDEDISEEETNPKPSKRSSKNNAVCSADGVNKGTWYSRSLTKLSRCLSDCEGEERCAAVVVESYSYYRKTCKFFSENECRYIIPAVKGKTYKRHTIKPYLGALGISSSVLEAKSGLSHPRGASQHFNFTEWLSTLPPTVKTLLQDATLGATDVELEDLLILTPDDLAMAASVSKLSLDQVEKGLGFIRRAVLLYGEGNTLTHGKTDPIQELYKLINTNPSARLDEHDGEEWFQDRPKGPDKLTPEQLLEIPEISSIVRHMMWKENRYRHEIASMSDVQFEMLKPEHRKAKARLEEIMKKAPKFICINDDMGTKGVPVITMRYLRLFYEKYYPSPCPFELPPDSPNPYHHIHTLRLHRARQAFSYTIFTLILLAGMAYGVQMVFPEATSKIRLRVQQVCRMMAPRTHST
ncbi:hypothetical protein AAMO2058_000707400 [Amorphochlora amoebiformis]